MLQLVKGGARDHPPDRSQRAVRAKAAGCGGKAEPHFSVALLDSAGQSAIINDLPANGFDAAGTLQRFRADENAAAGSACRFAPGIGDPGGRVKLEEEKDESRNQHPFGQRLALEPYHAGDRKSTRLNSSYMSISYAVFCLKKKKKTKIITCFKKKKKHKKTKIKIQQNQ